jgi:hypothetical protein
MHDLLHVVAHSAFTASVLALEASSAPVAVRLLARDRRSGGASRYSTHDLSAETRDADTLYGAFCARSRLRYTGASALAAGGAAASSRPPDRESVPRRRRGGARRLDRHLHACRAYRAPSPALARGAGAVPTVSRLKREVVIRDAHEADQGAAAYLPEFEAGADGPPAAAQRRLQRRIS